VKIQLDECISYKVASAVIALANRKGVEVSYVREFNQKRTPDPEWIARFAAEGGTAIISGDHGILQHWPNLIAYTESGLIVLPTLWISQAEGVRASGLAHSLVASNLDREKLGSVTADFQEANRCWIKLLGNGPKKPRASGRRERSCAASETLLIA
jgi:hypothetical protein